MLKDLKNTITGIIRFHRYLIGTDWVMMGDSAGGNGGGGSGGGFYNLYVADCLCGICKFCLDKKKYL